MAATASGFKIFIVLFMPFRSGFQWLAVPGFEPGECRSRTYKASFMVLPDRPCDCVSHHAAPPHQFFSRAAVYQDRAVLVSRSPLCDFFGETL